MDTIRMTQRNDALLNGALMALGLLGILDNVLVHWLLELHRAIPGPNAWEVEIALVIVSAVLLVAGGWRELRARKGQLGSSSR